MSGRGFFWIVMVLTMGAVGVVVFRPELLWQFEKAKWERFTASNGIYSAEFPGKPRCSADPDFASAASSCRFTIWNLQFMATEIVGLRGARGAGADAIAKEVAMFGTILEQRSGSLGGVSAEEFLVQRKKGLAIVRGVTDARGTPVLVSVTVRDAESGDAMNRTLEKRAGTVERFFGSFDVGR